jgi:hypothetical protein
VSRQKSKSGRRGRGYVQKPKSNVYTMMLILSFLFLCGACLFLHLEMDRYDYQMKPPAGAGS